MGGLGGLRDAAMRKVMGLADDVANSRVVQTIRQGGFLGAKGGTNPWKQVLEDLTDQDTLRYLSRSFDLSGLDEAGAKELAKRALEAQQNAKMFSKGKQMLGIAEEMGLPQRGALDKVLRHTGGTLRDANPLNMLVGSSKSRAQAMHDLWEGGLVGWGSTPQKTLTPGDALFENASKYRNALLGQEAMPGLRQLGQDALETTKAIAKPLVAAGAIFPIASIASRIQNPENYDESALKGSLRDAGWYAGGAIGLPAGVLGFQAGSALGQNVGAAIGEGLESGAARIGRGLDKGLELLRPKS